MQIIHKVLLRIGSGEWNKSLQDDAMLPYGANPDQAKMRGCLTIFNTWLLFLPLLPVF